MPILCPEISTFSNNPAAETWKYGLEVVTGSGRIFPPPMRWGGPVFSLKRMIPNRIGTEAVDNSRNRVALKKWGVLNGNTTHVHPKKNIELRSGLPDYFSGIPDQAFFTEYRSHRIPVPSTSLARSCRGT